MSFQARDGGDAVVAAGHGNPAEAESPENHAERQRDHQEVDVAHMRDQQAEGRAIAFCRAQNQLYLFSHFKRLQRYRCVK